jgi:hypothetical protein
MLPFAILIDTTSLFVAPLLLSPAVLLELVGLAIIDAKEDSSTIFF